MSKVVKNQSGSVDAVSASTETGKAATSRRLGTRHSPSMVSRSVQRGCEGFHATGSDVAMLPQAVPGYLAA